MFMLCILTDNLGKYFFLFYRMFYSTVLRQAGYVVIERVNLVFIIDLKTFPTFTIFGPTSRYFKL